MASQIHLEHAALACFDARRQDIVARFAAALETNDTPYARLVTGEPVPFAQRIVDALRESLAHHNAAPLVSALRLETDSPALRETLDFIAVLRHSAFMAYAPCVEEQPAVGTSGLNAIAGMTDQASAIMSEQRLGEVADAAAQQANDLHLFRSLTENATDGILVADPGEQLIYANPAFRQMTGYDQEVFTMKSFEFLYEDITRLPELVEHFARHPAWQGVLTYARKDGSTFKGHVSTFPIYETAGPMQAWAAVIRDVTTQMETEQERLHLQEQVIAAQQEALRQLGTPLIVLNDDIVAMPLVGRIDSERAQHMTESLLEGVATHQATIAVLDITGVPTVDTATANTLLQAARAVRLLGAQVILTGIRPDVAQTLIHLQLDMGDVRTFGTFQKGLDFALAYCQRHDRTTQ
jgi:PAS domain S-box-containing protein